MIISFLFIFLYILCKGKKTIIRYVLAAKNCKNIKFAHWSIQQLPFYTKISYSLSLAALSACQKSINSFS